MISLWLRMSMSPPETMVRALPAPTATPSQANPTLDPRSTRAFCSGRHSYLSPLRDLAMGMLGAFRRTAPRTVVDA